MFTHVNLSRCVAFFQRVARAVGCFVTTRFLRTSRNPAALFRTRTSVAVTKKGARLFKVVGLISLSNKRISQRCHVAIRKEKVLQSGCRMLFVHGLHQILIVCAPLNSVLRSFSLLLCMPRKSDVLSLKIERPLRSPIAIYRPPLHRFYDFTSSPFLHSGCLMFFALSQPFRTLPSPSLLELLKTALLFSSQFTT
jgi:hypothetical protein